MNSNAVGEVIPINDLDVPDTLNKYRSFSNSFHKKAIFNQELYIPSANEFNDPFDSKIPFRYNEAELTEENIYKKSLQIAKLTQSNLTEEKYLAIAYRIQEQGLLNDSHHLEQFDKRTFDRLCADYGIYCLTPDEKSLLMWSYYSDSHKGFCIGYNSKYLVKCGLFGAGGEVAYKDEFPKLPLFLTKDDHPLLNILFTKWTNWKHENEYRLLHTYKKGKTHIIPKEAITEIVLGCQIDEKRKYELIGEIQNFLPHVKLTQIDLAKEIFGLNKVTIFDPNYFI